MAMPMSAALSAGASFTPSPVIATTSPRACSAATIRSLCSGATRAIDGRPARGVHEALLVEGVQFGAAVGACRARPADTQVAGDPLGGHRMVAGDHDGPDAGAMGLGDRLRDLGAWRIHDSDASAVDEPALGVLTEGVRVDVGGLPVGDAEGAIAALREPDDGRQRRRARRLVERHRLGAHQPGRATGQQHVGSPLGEHADRIVVGAAAEHRHELAFRGEGQLGLALVLRHPRHDTLQLVLRDEEGGLGRIALNRPLAVGLVEPRVVRQHPSGQHAQGLRQHQVFVADHASRRRSGA